MTERAICEGNGRAMAAMPDADGTGLSYRLNMFTNICNFDRRRYKPDSRSYGSLNIVTALSEAPVFPDCGDKAGAFIRFLSDGDWESGSDIRFNDLSQGDTTWLGALAADYPGSSHRTTAMSAQRLS